MQQENDWFGVKTFVLSLSLVVLIAAVIISGCVIAYTLIDYMFAADTSSWDRYRDIITSLPLATSLLLVLYVLLLYVSRLLRKDIPLQKGAWRIACQVVVMCILVGSVAVAVVPVAVLFAGILKNTVMMPLFLKSLCTSIAGSAVFRYYRGVLYPTKRPYSQIEKRVITGGVSLSILVLVIFSSILINLSNHVPLPLYL